MHNIIVNDRRRILCATKGHPAWWNNESFVCFDELALALWQRRNSSLDEHELSSLECTETGEVASVKHCNVWLLVDNGCLAWLCTMPPMKVTVHHAKLHFLQWLESLRKDVECTFGILNGHFCVLKCGTHSHGIKSCNKVWCTCHTLRNVALEHDGMETVPEEQDHGHLTRKTFKK